MVNRMIFNQTGFFGRGAIAEIPAAAKSRGFTKAMIVTDPILADPANGTAKKVTDVLDAAGIGYEIFTNVKPNPPCRVHSGRRRKVQGVRCGLPDRAGWRFPAGYVQGHWHCGGKPGVFRRFVTRGHRGYQESGGSDLWRSHNRWHRVRNHDQLCHHRYGEQAKVCSR